MRRAHAARLIPTCVGSTSGSASMRSVWSAHPHVCGEHSAVLRHIASGCGSSPRVWGARAYKYWAVSMIRLIPTCVGSTGTLPLGGLARSAHPHVCGEHVSSKSGRRGWRGSSPRVWGARNPQPIPVKSGRLIPTCVGSTLGWCSSLPAAPAHPHVCGEHISPFAAHGSAVGSSPRVWGAPHLRFRLGAARRLIPTCVGSTHPE